MTPRKGIAALPALWALTLLISGCVGLDEPMSPLAIKTVPSSTVGTTDATSSLFYPLDLGNHWEYQRTFSIQTVPTGEVPGPPEILTSKQSVDLIGTQELYGREYVVQLEAISDGDVTFEFRYLYRQDRSGLFSADPPGAARRELGRSDAVGRERGARAMISGLDARYQAAALRLLEKQRLIREVALHGSRTTPPSSRSLTTRLGKGPLDGEIALLLYPLHPHQTWHIREDPLVIYTVEGHEALKLPAGTFQGLRVRIDWPDLFGPEDHVVVWYGRDGYLALQAHVELDVVDESGQTIGSVISDEGLELTGLALVKSANQAP